MTDIAAIRAAQAEAEAREAEWKAMVEAEVAKGRCPYSGLAGPECKSYLCDCFEFEDQWGVSQK